MRYGIVNGIKTSADNYVKSENDILICPCCDSEIIPKQGDIKIWHFAHKSKIECDSWYRGMTEWHKNWQNLFPLEYREVIHKCELTNEKHIADIKTKDNIIIEFQHSSITPQEIKAREKFYGEKMIWVLDSNSFKVNNVHYIQKKETKNTDETKEKLLEILNLSEHFYQYNIYQKAIKFTTKSYFFEIAQRPIFIDLNDGNLLYMKFKKGHIIKKVNNVILDVYHQDKDSIPCEGYIIDTRCSIFSYNQDDENIRDVRFNIDISFDIDRQYQCMYNAGIKISKENFIKKYA